MIGDYTLTVPCDFDFEFTCVVNTNGNVCEEKNEAIRLSKLRIPNVFMRVCCWKKHLVTFSIFCSGNGYLHTIVNRAFDVDTLRQIIKFFKECQERHDSITNYAEQDEVFHELMSQASKVLCNAMFRLYKSHGQHDHFFAEDCENENEKEKDENEGEDDEESAESESEEDDDSLELPQAQKRCTAQ